MPNIENNIDIYSPFGISIFANSIDVLKGIDIAYDSFVNEIQLGRKRLFASKDILRVDSTTGHQEFVFDPQDIVFHILEEPMSGGDEDINSITTSSIACTQVFSLPLWMYPLIIKYTFISYNRPNYFHRTKIIFSNF